MRSTALGAVFAILISGAVSEIVRNINVNAGQEFTLSVTTLAHDVITCHLNTPSLGVISFIPGDSSYSTEKYVIGAGQLISVCEVTVTNADANDQGEWSLTYDASGDVEPRVQQYNIKVEGHNGEIEVGVAADDFTALPLINHLTKTGDFIHITLSKESFEEECSWIAPEVKAEDENEKKEIEEEISESVKVHEKSNFVSCRIVIGPMTEKLLGDWRLCGKSAKDQQRRCQPVNIAWNNIRAPYSNWVSRTHPAFNHVVNYGGSINPGVQGTGDVQTCHVITPNGEDLVLATHAEYPHVERVSLENPSLCSVLIKDIDEATMGTWTVYGKFMSVVNGLNEERLPIVMSLYNEDDPFEQAYNVTTLPEIDRLVNLGTNTTVAVTGSVINSCQVTTPSGQIIELGGTKTYEGVTFVNEEGRTSCAVNIGPITKDLLGEWELIGKFSDGNLFNERVQTFRIIEEDPENPIEESHREVVLLTAQTFNTSMEGTHRVIIDSGVFTEGESCHIRTPNGRQYTIMDGFHIDGVEVITGDGIECGVIINVVNEDLIGEWVLISRAIRLSSPIERRLHFTIYVEERVNAIPAVVNMAVGTDLYLRLQESTNSYDTCKLIGPNNEIVSYKIDEVYKTACGFVVQSVDASHSGEWEITYGNKIIYRAFTHVNVFASTPVTVETQSWTLGNPVQTVLGPEDAVYCRLRDPNGLTVFEDFGQCTVDIERATAEHQGVWRMSVVMSGNVVPQELAFVVDIAEAGTTPIVSTSVVRAAPSVLLTCSVPAQYQVKGCKFRDHRGNLMIAHQGVGQDGVSTSTGYESESTSSSCTLRLTSPSSADLGLWRCAVDTDDGTHYAFLTVTCPWLMQNPEVAAAVVLEPSVTQEQTAVSSFVGDSTTMSCSIDASIRYCHFRARNGTIFNVRPGFSSDVYEYVGSGFDSGECGIRFRNLMASDSGRWSCHIGLIASGDTEHVGQFEVTVQEKMTTSHERDSAGHGLVLVAHVAAQPRLEYCRFVRIDGLGFTSENVPAGYSVSTSLLDQGTCSLHMAEATMLNLHPWTVVAKLRGVDREVVAATTNTELLPYPSNPAPDAPGPGQSNAAMISLWLSVALLALGLLTLSVALIPAKNRRWTQARASQFRNSFKKQPLPADFIIPEKMTPQTA